MHINIFMSSYAYVGVSSYIGNFNINHLTRNKRRKTFSRSKFLAICKGVQNLQKKMLIQFIQRFDIT